MKTYKKIIIGIIAILGLILVFGIKIVPDSEYHGIPAELTSNETDIVINFSSPSVYPYELAICTKNTHLYDVFLESKDKMIADEIARRNAEEEANYTAKMIGIELRYNEHHDAKQKVEEAQSVFMERHYKKLWYRWEIYAGPSKSGDERRIGIYLNETVICDNTT